MKSEFTVKDSIVSSLFKRWTLLLVALLTFAGGVEAGTNGFVVPLFRGSAGSTLGFWEVFSAPVGAPGNPADQPGATSRAILTQTDTNAFLTGSGNIYNMANSSFSLTDTTTNSVGTVALQIRTLGSELDYNSVLLVYTNASGAQSVAPLFRYELNRAAAQGSSVSSLWQWDLTGLDVNAYTISFVAGGPSLSFDSMTLDTAPQFTAAFAEQPFTVRSAAANLSRWNYPFNGNPTGRPTASVFGSLGSSPDFDSRDAQYLLDWNTTNQVTAGHGPINYLLKSARITLTIASGNQYPYSGTLRDYRSYFPTNDARYVAPVDGNNTVDLFGVGYRAEYSPTNWGVNPEGGFYTNRISYPAGFDTNGLLVDVSNNVGDDGTNEITGAFEVAPFAVGQSTNVAPGELMPEGSQLTFDLNLNDPLIYSYVQHGLNEGNLGFMATSLIAASLSGPPTYPNFYTIHSPIATSNQYPLLDIQGEIVRPQIDGDADGLPDDWENFHFGSLGYAAADDPDGDGATNIAEYQAGTVPSNDSSLFGRVSLKRQDGVAEVYFPPAPGKQYFVQWSENLPGWQSATNSPIHYSSVWLAKTGTNLVYPAPVYAVGQDTNSAGLHRFYRVGSP